MDLVYDALDAFSLARRLARDADTEIEAQAEALIGKTLYKLLGRREKARKHLM